MLQRISVESKSIIMEKRANKISYLSAQLTNRSSSIECRSIITENLKREKRGTKITFSKAPLTKLILLNLSQLLRRKEPP